MPVKPSRIYDLTSPLSNELIYGPGEQVRSVTLKTCPAGVTVRVRVGAGQPFGMGQGDVLTGLTDADAIAGIYCDADATGGLLQFVAGANA